MAYCGVERLDETGLLVSFEYNGKRRIGRIENVHRDADERIVSITIDGQDNESGFKRFRLDRMESKIQCVETCPRITIVLN